jgi:DNA-directed RNA polymerase subunit RPC12/RpoP
MSSQTPDRSQKEHWESAHVCLRCERIINLAEIDLMTVTTGIVACPNCDWSGPIEIRVMDGKLPKKKK